jgi:hypothetical protein
MSWTLALREAVAKLYNESYRKGKESQYTFENVCIVPGGRAGLSRVAAVISDVYCVRPALPSSRPKGLKQRNV